MNPRSLLIAAAWCAALATGPVAASTPVTASTPPDPALRLALKQAVEGSDSFRDRFQAQVWLGDMSRRLQKRIPDPFYRLELLRTIHHETTRLHLEPELVLALIEVESAFDRFAISVSGAQGLMQVMPFWKKEIGHPGDNLFNPSKNLRYGCAILKFYMDQENGNVQRALARYNGSMGVSWEYSRRVFRAYRTRWYPN
ncbi:MAG: lytic transglycosylase domain-containing protein [Gammaproteobacteria bacterium]|nr:lytic transglycosylase domain-containing protein [Gammaproteobacteria bacterium]